MRTVAVIPARYKSSRFPGKPLVNLMGKPMILHVCELTSKALEKENVFVATDDIRIASVVEEAGFNVIMTKDTALTGTDRLWDAAKQIKADYYLNIQGDEPLLNPEDIILIKNKKLEIKNGILNGMCKLEPTEDPASVNIPKVIYSESNQKMIYMSRLPIPGIKAEKNKPKNYWKQVCIYAFSHEELKRFGEFGRKSYLEEKEDIEILRFLELNVPVFMVKTSGTTYAVDTPDDVEIVENEMRAHNK